jgi:hypothetical protein
MAAHTYLNQVASCLRAKEISVRTRVLLAREPARAITHYARQHKIDLIAMATHGRSRLTRRIGGVAVQMLRDGTLPMLLYWPQERLSSPDSDMHPQSQTIATDDNAHSEVGKYSD